MSNNIACRNIESFLPRIIVPLKESESLRDIRVISVKNHTLSTIAKLRGEGLRGEKKFVIKINTKNKDCNDRNSRLKDEVEKLKFLHEKFGPGLQNIAKPLFYFDECDFEAIVMDEIKGDTLEAIIIRELGKIHQNSNHLKLGQFCFSIGRWLRKFQTITAATGDEKSAFQNLIKHIYRQLTVSAKKNALDKKILEKVHLYVDERRDCWRSLPRNELVGVHSDFIPVNILVQEDSGEIFILDFEKFKFSFGCNDVVSFLSCLDFMSFKFLFKKAATKHWKDKFKQGYGEINEDAPLVGLYKIRWNLGYLDLACNSFQHRIFKRLFFEWIKVNIQRRLSAIVNI